MATETTALSGAPASGVARATRYLPWLVILLLLALAPLFVPSGYVHPMNQMLIAALFAMAFNMLMGQAGMLSFGHAAYFGVGMFAAIHLMEFIDTTAFYLPTPLVPLAGAVSGLIIGAMIGYFTTLRTGVYFAMLTLAFAEILHALAPRWDGLFGGESGMSTWRPEWWIFSFSSAVEVYYLTLFWVVLCIVLMYLYTRTPFGRLAFALRENDQRVRFMGYDVHRTKITVFALSAMFAGVAGSLQGITNETANYVIFGPFVSAQVVLNTFIGGAGVFMGPALGGALMTLFGHFVSEVSRSWLLYQGILFVLVVMFAPKGIAGVILAHERPWAQRRMGSLIAPYAVSLCAGLLLLAGTVVTVELLHMFFSDSYAAMRFRADGAWVAAPVLGTTWHPFGFTTWAVPVVLFATGFLALRHSVRQVRGAWEVIHEDDTEPRR